MSNSLVNMFRIEELRKKIMYTFLMLVVFRIGAFSPIPGIDPEVLKLYFLSQSNSSTIGLTEYLNFFAGGAFSNFSVFMLGIMPYISTQIILQLLMLVVPSLKKLAEDAAGRKKMQQYTRYGTILVCLIQSYVVTVYVKSIPDVMTIPFLPFTLIAMLTVTTGTMLLVWVEIKLQQKGLKRYFVTYLCWYCCPYPERIGNSLEKRSKRSIKPDRCSGCFRHVRGSRGVGCL